MKNEIKRAKKLGLTFRQFILCELIKIFGLVSMATFYSWFIIDVVEKYF